MRQKYSFASEQPTTKVFVLWWCSICSIFSILSSHPGVTDFYVSLINWSVASAPMHLVKSSSIRVGNHVSTSSPANMQGMCIPSMYMTKQSYLPTWDCLIIFILFLISFTSFTSCFPVKSYRIIRTPSNTTYIPVCLVTIMFMIYNSLFAPELTTLFESNWRSCSDSRSVVKLGSMKIFPFLHPSMSLSWRLGSGCEVGEQTIWSTGLSIITRRIIVYSFSLKEPINTSQF